MNEPTGSHTHAVRPRGRPREFDIDTALDRAIRVFREHGYNATSIGDLIGAMGLASGSIYKAFKDKRAVFLAAFERYMSLRNEQLRQVADTAKCGRERLIDVLAFYVEILKRHRRPPRLSRRRQRRRTRDCRSRNRRARERKPCQKSGFPGRLDPSGTGRQIHSGPRRSGSDGARHGLSHPRHARGRKGGLAAAGCVNRGRHRDEARCLIFFGECQ